MCSLNKSGDNSHYDNYTRNHQNTLYAVLKTTRRRNGRVTLEQVADLTGVTLRSLYNHYPDIRSAEFQGVEEMLADFEAQYDKQGHKYSKLIPDGNRLVFYILMVYMSQRRKLFNIICKEVRHHGIIHRMVKRAFRRLDLHWLPVGIAVPNFSSERVGMCISMLVEVIARWGRETRCDINRADRYLDRMMRIVKAAEQNALP